MSIRTTPMSETNSTAGTIPPLLFADLKNLYLRRAERLRALATEHSWAKYLQFAAQLVEAQQQVLHDHPLSFDATNALAEIPLDVQMLPRTRHWHHLLHALIAELHPNVDEPIQAVLENLQKMATGELEALATDLLAGNYGVVGSDKALFLWAALSLYWAQMATQLNVSGTVEYGEQRQHCPVCRSMPVASVVHIAAKTNGLRYLHCSLCESEWHMVRVKCSNCEQTGALDYWSLDDKNAAIKAESCGDCGSYLKILYQEKDPRVEAVADDLASLALDALLEEQGQARSSINPFLFPSE